MTTFLGGRVIATQSENGFRSGLDAVMLAAAVPARAGETVLELGAGAGTASLCLAARIAGLALDGVEIDPALAALARENAAAGGVTARFVAADVFDLPAGLKRDFDHVFCNPPFHHAAGVASPDPSRARALGDTGRLAQWLTLGLKRTVSDGSFTAILRADRLGEALAALGENGVNVFPLWPRAGVPAKRVIVQARKAARTALTLLPGLVLHDAAGRYTPEAEAILRGGGALALDSARL